MITKYRCRTVNYGSERGIIESGFDSETGENQSRTLPNTHVHERGLP